MSVRAYCFIFGIVGCSMVNTLFSQVFVMEQPLFEEVPFFNEDWIANKKIKKIDGKVAFKKDRHPITPSDNMYQYQFDRNGKLISIVSVFSIRNRLDTAYTYFIYGIEGRMEKIVKSDAYGFYGLNYRYNSEGQVTRVFHTREQKNSIGKPMFHLQEIIWDDSISHTTTPLSSKGVYFNQVGKPYKEVVKWTDVKGILLQKKSRNYMGDDETRWTYSRSENGQLLSVSEKSTMKGSLEIRKSFSYDQQQRCEKEVVEKNGKLYTTRRISYGKNGMMELQLTRNNSTKRMEIVEYDYTFY